MVGFGASHSRGAAVKWGVDQPLSLPGFQKRVLIMLVACCVIYQSLCRSSNFELESFLQQEGFTGLYRCFQAGVLDSDLWALVTPKFSCSSPLHQGVHSRIPAEAVLWGELLGQRLQFCMAVG